MAYRVLSVGPVSQILVTRNEVLRKAGFLVETSIDLNQALRLFLEEDFDGALLCHTIPNRDKERLVRLLKQEKPMTPVAVMIDGVDAPYADLEINSLDGPERLLSQLAELIARSQPGTASGTA